MKTPTPRASHFSALAICAMLTSISACSPSTESTAASTTVGTELDDSIITTRVRSALLANNEVNSLDIKVETSKGEVMLSGFAENDSQIERGLAVARGVEGVKQVKNHLSLKEGSQSMGNKLDDSVLTASVKSALFADPLMKSMEVSVVTRKGEVQLSGFVDTAAQASRAQELARAVEGVTRVDNQMSVRK